MWLEYFERSFTTTGILKRSWHNAITRAKSTWHKWYEQAFASMGTNTYDIANPTANQPVSCCRFGGERESFQNLQLKQTMA